MANKLDLRQSVWCSSSDLMSWKNAAALLQVSTRELRRLVEAGRIPMVECDGWRLFLRQHLLTYMADREWWRSHESKVKKSRIKVEVQHVGEES